MAWKVERWVEFGHNGHDLYVIWTTRDEYRWEVVGVDGIVAFGTIPQREGAADDELVAQAKAAAKAAADRLPAPSWMFSDDGMPF